MNYQLHASYLYLQPLVDNIETHFQDATHILHIARNDIRVVTFAGEAYVIKSFNIPNSINRFAYRFLRDSKAKRSYNYSLTLGDDICPAPVAYIEHFQHGLLAQSYYISRYFDYDFTLRPLLDEVAFENRQGILQHFAAFTYQLHQNGILHRDYSPGNILIKKQEKGYQFKIIDVNRMHFKRLNLNDRLTNFARLMTDDATLKTIVYHYAQLINKPANELFALAIKYRDQFASRRKLKNTLRGR